jgi:hypothetical protein
MPRNPTIDEPLCQLAAIALAGSVAACEPALLVRVHTGESLTPYALAARCMPARAANSAACQLRQRLPGANHTVVAATAACRTLCVVTNEIRFLPRITLSVWISRALLFGDSRWARQYAPVQRRRHLTLTAVQRCRTSERRWLSRRGAQSHQLHKQRGKRSLRKLRAGGTASARRA